MTHQEFFKTKTRILENLNEFTDDAILSDGSIGIISGSTQDMGLCSDEEYEHYAELIGAMTVPVSAKKEE